MTTPEPGRGSHRPGRLLVPGVAVAGGIAYLVAGLVGGDTGFGIVGLIIMVVLAGTLLLVGRRSETVDGLLSRRDERINTIDRDASLAAGLSLIVAVLVMFVVEVARGRDGSPYDWLAGLAGAIYLVALVVLRFTR